MGVVSILRLFLCVSILKYNFHFVCTNFYIFFVGGVMNVSGIQT